jgi:SAM-dependent methyltransferase
MYSWVQRLRSLRHRLSLGISERLRWSRGPYREKPARELPVLPAERAQRIAALRDRYQARFESELGVSSSLNNYEYLDILDGAFRGAALTREGGVVCDVGSASFWYAPALHAFFRPQRLIGVEVEGHRLLRGFRSRIDYARGYVSLVPNAEFVVADYAAYSRSADVITAWFPFLTPNAILAWRLPLSLLAPARLIARVRDNLAPGGIFFMANHGPREAQRAEELCIAAGLMLVWKGGTSSVLGTHRLEPPMVSLWRAGGAKIYQGDP